MGVDRPDRTYNLPSKPELSCPTIESHPISGGTVQSVKLETLADCAAIFPRVEIIRDLSVVWKCRPLSLFLKKREGMKQRKRHQ